MHPNQFSSNPKPSPPLAVAFALAAIISPTDPVAVSAIAARTPIPNRLMHILEGESLLNDASGLVCMRFAVVAALTGTFSLVDASTTFLWLAIGGVAIGVAVTWGITQAKHWASRRLGEEAGSQVLLSLLIPFGAYLLAERLGCSGILAAVGAGITMSYAEQTGGARALTRVRRTAFWDTVQFGANGVIFVLLGEQLPTIVAGAEKVVRETGHQDRPWLLIYVVAINAALAVLRFVWVWVSLRFTLLTEVRHGRRPVKPSWRLVAATSIAGVRGAVTLAGVLTLPLALNDGSPFPARDLAILLAAGVIIVSLIAASIGLAPLLKGLELPPEPSHREEEDRARIIAAEAAIKAIVQAQHDLAQKHRDAGLCAAAGARMMQIYRQRIERELKTGEEAEQVREIENVERELRLAGIRAERDTLFQLARARMLPEETARNLVRDLDLLETRYVAT